VTVADIRRRTAEAMSDAGDDPKEHACMRCQGPASHSEMSAFGARCRRCYEAYKREPQPSRRYAQGGKQPVAREVVQRLLDRQTSGEAMSKAQLDFITIAGRRTYPELRQHGDPE